MRLHAGDPVRALGEPLPIRKVPESGPVTPGAVVEILEVGAGTICPIPKIVKVNGTEVGLIAENGVAVDPGDGTSPARVTLTLLPRRIIIGYADGDGTAEAAK